MKRETHSQIPDELSYAVSYDEPGSCPLFECIGDRAICVLAPFTGQWIEVSKILSAPTP